MNHVRDQYQNRKPQQIDAQITHKFRFPDDNPIGGAQRVKRADQAENLG